MMKMGMKMLDAGNTCCAVKVLIQRALHDGPRDLTREEAAQLRELAVGLLCAALEMERIALGIPAPRSTRG